MEIENIVIDNHVDDHVDNEIEKCFDMDNPKSFFTFAGAGSGKTRSLVNTLSFLDSQLGSDFAAYSRKIAVITYTNAACDEILSRVDYKSIFAVSTIHSFLWELIKDYQRDIKEWVKASIVSEIEDLEAKQARGRASAASNERAAKIISNRERLNKLEKVKRFSYNPNGENFGYDSLNHAEVIKMGSAFIAEKETMQRILVSKYPILLIDESQDTKKELIDALLVLYNKHKTEIIIGMFGDTMQKIYTDGKDNLALCIPEDWEKPTKIMNHRSSSRIVTLANSIRKNADKQIQKPRSDAAIGTVRLFIVPSTADKQMTEKAVANMMSEVTNDVLWLLPNECQSLILEHHMAASRLGFSDLYAPLYEVKSFRTGILDGSLPELSMLIKMVLPLIKAYLKQQSFEVTKIVRQYSPLMDKKSFNGENVNQIQRITVAEKAVNDLCALWNEDKIPSCLDILHSIKKNGLFNISERLQNVLSDDLPNTDDKIIALKRAFSASFTQLENYNAYINNETPFATHQGVKGLQFPRVMVIMDDEEAEGFLFSYDKLFGAKEKTDTDLRNEREGKDTSIARTTRLFYVACTRAQKSLALVGYTGDIDAVRSTVLANGWFEEKEIVIFQ